MSSKPLLINVLLLAVLAGPALADEKAPEKQKMSHQAKGTFDVKLAPLAFEGQPEGGEMGRMSLAKTFQGDLTGTGAGQMLFGGVGKGTGVYVAIEKVEGTLNGKTGTFQLYHRGVMRSGQPDLEVLVVPDSGTGELAGLEGTLKIIIADGKHSYELDYTLPTP